MLTLLMLAFLSDPTTVSAAPGVEIDRPVARVAPRVDQATRRCQDELIAADASASTGSLLDRRRDDGQVRKYLLLDRRDQNGCPLPISYPVPDQPNALGRNLLAPDPVAPLRPGRPAR